MALAIVWLRTPPDRRAHEATVAASAKAPLRPAELDLPKSPSTPASGAWLGVKLGPEVEHEGRPGVLLTGTYLGSAAEIAGVLPYDILEEIDGELVGTANGVRESIRSRRPGSRVRLSLRRAAESFVVEVRLAGGAEARAAYEVGCAAARAADCNALGAIFAEGALGFTDALASVTLFSKACELGAQDGCFNLGTSLLEGRGVEKDPLRARDLFAKACDAGVGVACSRLGLLLGDAKEASVRHERGCELGSGPSCTWLGVLHARLRTGRERSYFERACDARDAAGCLDAAIVLERELGAATQVAALYERACGLGESRGCLRN